jgi:hypothetical protein
MDITPNMVGHPLLATLIDRSDDFDDLFGLDLPRWSVAPERVRDLVRPFSVSFHERLPMSFRYRT